jgi:hypothetical protein
LPLLSTSVTCSLRLGDRQGNAGQAGTGAEIGERTGVHVRVHRQRVEQVPAQHLAAFAHGVRL